MPATRRRQRRHLRNPSGLELEIENFLHEGSEGLSNRFSKFAFLYVGEENEETDWIRAAYEVWTRLGEYYWSQPNPSQHIVYMHSAYGEPWNPRYEPPKPQLRNVKWHKPWKPRD